MFKVINPADKDTRKVGDPAFELLIEKQQRYFLKLNLKYVAYFRLFAFW